MKAVPVGEMLPMSVQQPCAIVHIDLNLYSWHPLYLWQLIVGMIPGFNTISCLAGTPSSDSLHAKLEIVLNNLRKKGHQLVGKRACLACNLDPL